MGHSPENWHTDYAVELSKKKLFESFDEDENEVEDDEDDEK